MTTTKEAQRLEGTPTSHGLYEDFGKLEHGGTKLNLKEFQFDSGRKLPLYVFSLSNETGDIVGEYHFAPGTPQQVGDIGNAGGHVDEAFRNRHHSQEAIMALGGVASRHGMNSFIITCPMDNAAARKGLGNVGIELENQGGTICYYQIPVSPSSGA